MFKEAANENIPQPVLEEFAWYAASLHKTGATIEAENIAQQLKSLDTQAYSTYEKLIKQEPCNIQLAMITKTTNVSLLWK